MNNQEERNIGLRDHAAMFLNEMEAMHRAMRTLVDGGYIEQASPQQAFKYAEDSLFTLLEGGYVLNREGTRIYGSPAVIDSIQTILLSAPVRASLVEVLHSVGRTQLVEMISTVEDEDGVSLLLKDDSNKKDSCCG